MTMQRYLPQTLAFVMFLLMALGGSPMPAAIRILAMLAAMGVYILIFRVVAFNVLVRWWPLLLLPIISLLSAFWSEAPGASIRYGLQIMITAFVGLLMAKTLSTRHMILINLLVMFVYCVICLIDGTKGPSQHGWVIIGYSGSKNAMAGNASLLLMCALGALLMGKLSVWSRALALLSIVLATFFVLQSNSSGALVIAAGSAAVLLGIWVAKQMTPGARLVAVFVTAAALVPVALMLPEIMQGYDHFVYDTLGKDPTLSGRAELWARADLLIAERPWVGHGYRAVWMGDGTETEALQRITGISDLRTYNFHDFFRQVRVDLGYLGISAFLGAALVTLVCSILVLIALPDMSVSFFVVLFLATVSRMPFEVFLGPFSQGTVLFYAGYIYIISHALGTSGVSALRSRLTAATNSRKPTGWAPS